MILRARVLLPVSRPPIDDGAVCISGNKISAVGRWSELKSTAAEKIVDLGETVLLPGLVNAHCHLDYTDMAEMIPPTRFFTDWIKSLLALKSQWSYSEFAKSWTNGAQMLLRTGTTTVADIEAVPELLPDVWSTTPLRIFSFLEMTSVKNRRDANELLEEVGSKINASPNARGGIGISPHALYSTTPELLELAAQKARERNWTVTTHVAESQQEFEMFAHSRGALFDWLKTQRDMSDCGHGSPVQQLARLGLLSENFLAIHVNYLAEGDARILHEKKVNVVHCPRSHSYFRHQDFPFEELARNGVNVCLGTDSLASVNKVRAQRIELNMFAEMKSFRATQPNILPATVLQMATQNGARALGLPGKIGELVEDSFADLIALPFHGRITDAYEAVIQHPRDVSASMIHGAWAIRPAEDVV